jgi:hypothetical protein
VRRQRDGGDIRCARDGESRGGRRLANDRHHRCCAAEYTDPQWMTVAATRREEGMVSGGSVAAPGRWGRIARRAWRIAPLILLLFVSLFLFFSITARVVRGVREARNDELVRNGAAVGVRPWMTIPYIARAYGLPEGDLYAALNLTPSERTRRAPLGALAEHSGRNLDADIATINALIAARHATPRAPRPPQPPRPSPAPGGNP